jgi:hypothetical protein
MISNYNRRVFKIKLVFYHPICIIVTRVSITDSWVVRRTWTINWVSHLWIQYQDLGS